MPQNLAVPQPAAPRAADILLVDDRPENLTALRAILSDLPGVQLVDAPSGAAALRELLRRDFALVVLDAFLPGMDGFEVARLMKERERTRDVPVLFLTAESVDHALLRRAYEVGAADYMVKPISPEILRAKVSVFVDLARKNALVHEQAGRLQEVERRERATELAEMRSASERRYLELAESIPQVVWRALPDGRLEYFNQRWFDYTGADPDTHAEAGSYLHPEDRQKCEEAWDAARIGGNAFQCECRLLRHDGAYRWHLRRALPERDFRGEIIAWLGTDTDIDDRKRADDERIELLVRERAARFQAEAAQKRAAELYVEAREAVRARDEFLTVAAHELRTPLTTLRIESQRLARARSEGAPGLLRSVERLCKLIEQLLDVSRLEGGKIPLHFERADLRAAVQEAAARLRTEAERAGCSLEVRGDVSIQADFDPLRLEQVVSNLLTNAIKYGPGKPIEVTVARDVRNARILVRDHGIGVAKEQQGRIFERFARAVSVREYGGLGLGLYISRQIAEAHGGSIEVQSAPGEGATFVVEFPLERQPETRSEVH